MKYIFLLIIIVIAFTACEEEFKTADAYGNFEAKEVIVSLVSTSYMDEASLCDRVALIQKGKIMSIDTSKAIVNDFEKPLYVIKSDRIYQLIQDLRGFEVTHSAFPFGEYVHLATTSTLDKIVLKDYLIEKIIKKLKLKKRCQRLRIVSWS